MANQVAEFFNANGIPYPSSHHDKRCDENLTPYPPDFINNRYTRHQPIGQVDQLPPVPVQTLVQESAAALRAPQKYLLATEEQKQEVMLGYAQTLFDENLDVHAVDFTPELSAANDILQLLRYDHTTTKCNHL